jgi:hypothetical protein
MEDVSSPDDFPCEILKVLIKIFDEKLARIEGLNLSFFRHINNGL